MENFHSVGTVFFFFFFFFRSVLQRSNLQMFTVLMRRARGSLCSQKERFQRKYTSKGEGKVRQGSFCSKN